LQVVLQHYSSIACKNLHHQGKKLFFSFSEAHCWWLLGTHVRFSPGSFNFGKQAFRNIRVKVGNLLDADVPQVA
jgi:hypothetical protein